MAYRNLRCSVCEAEYGSSEAAMACSSKGVPEAIDLFSFFVNSRDPELVVRIDVERGIAKTTHFRNYSAMIFVLGTEKLVKMAIGEYTVFPVSLTFDRQIISRWFKDIHREPSPEELERILVLNKATFPD